MVIKHAISRFCDFAAKQAPNACIGVFFIKGRFRFCNTSKSTYMVLRNLHPQGFVGNYTVDVDISDLIEDMKAFL